jgi:hypothetical protein
MKRFPKRTKKEIRKFDLNLELHLDSPEMVIWSVIEELKDIQEFYYSNIFDFLRFRKKAEKHLLHQIERLIKVQKEIEFNNKKG